MKVFNHCWRWFMYNISSVYLEAIAGTWKTQSTLCSHSCQFICFIPHWTSTVYLQIKWGYLLNCTTQKAYSETAADYLYHGCIPCYSKENMMFSWRFSCWSNSHFILAQLISCAYWNSNSRPLPHSCVQEWSFDKLPSISHTFVHSFNLRRTILLPLSWNCQTWEYTTSACVGPQICKTFWHVEKCMNTFSLF